MIHYFQSFYFILSLFLLGYIVAAIAKYFHSKREYPVNCDVIYKPEKKDSVYSAHYLLSDMDPYQTEIRMNYQPDTIDNKYHERVLDNMINDENVVRNKL